MIDSFRDDYAWLSNFYPCPVKFEGDVYPSVEHAYQASKTLSRECRRMFQVDISPGTAKRLGRTVDIRSDWDAVKIPLMLTLLRQKFASPDLRSRLICTGSLEIVEGNNWGDRFWGVSGGRGENHLGRLLMLVRTEVCLPPEITELLG